MRVDTTHARARATEYWKRFEEISNLIRIKKQISFYPDLDLKEFF